MPKLRNGRPASNEGRGACRQQVKHANSGGLAKMSNEALAGIFVAAIQAHRKMLRVEEVGLSQP